MGRAQTEFEQQTGKAVREVGQERAREKVERRRETERWDPREQGRPGGKRRTKRASSQNGRVI